MSSTLSPLGAVTRGLVAGAVGTAAMTAAQTVYYKAMDTEGSSTPAEVGKRIIEGVLKREVSDELYERLNTYMHWGYGTSWGALLGLVAGSGDPGALKSGVLFGTAVWGASLGELPAMKLAPPPTQYSASQIAPDLGFHLVYGLAAAVAFRVLR